MSGLVYKLFGLLFIKLKVNNTIFGIPAMNKKRQDGNSNTTDILGSFRKLP